MRRGLAAVLAVGSLFLVAASAPRPDGAGGAPRGHGRPVPVSADALIRQRSAEAGRLLAAVRGRLRAVRDGERRLRELPASRRTAGVMAVLPQLRRQEEGLDRAEAALRRRIADGVAYSRLRAKQDRDRAARADVAVALAELRRLPPRARTPYLRAALRRLLERDAAVRREQAADARAAARLRRRLLGPLPVVRPGG